ncbi:hypothetical protein [uncultured Parabacteroides sp.]|jgi:hypothetical protein|uniref:hypothetical protein n=1 Tax=uncultured Parabacteroides sp. TaxID=512312 RepID=UPI0025D4C0EA|nr:hypothetical protein [uncultured Parabacteroides sp.]
MKTLTLVPIGGLANRFYAITSAIAFCKDYNVRLKVIWFKDKGMGADFHSLFELSEDVDTANVEIIDAKWYHYVYDRPRKRNFWLPLLWQRVIFDQILLEKDAYNEEISCFQKLKKGGNSYLVAFYPIYSKENMLCYLRPKLYIRRKIEHLKSSFGKNVIGVHIRRTDNALSIGKSPLDLYIDSMYKSIEDNPDVKFYVASDSKEEKEKLKKIFFDRIYFLDCVQKRDSLEGITDAIIELYLLSSTKKIYGSFASTYSTLAADISKIDCTILSV